jgi:hypothetical protein
MDTLQMMDDPAPEVKVRLSTDSYSKLLLCALFPSLTAFYRVF